MVKFKEAAILKDRADKFVPEIIKTKSVIYLKHPDEKDGIYVCESNHYMLCEIHGSGSDCECEEATAMDIVPVWAKSYEAYARGYGKNLVLKEIPLEEFTERMLPWMIEFPFLIGLNWDHQGFGDERMTSEIYDMITRGCL